MSDLQEQYKLNLRALERACLRIRDTYSGEDIDDAAIETHFALHLAYDLHEAYFKALGIRDQAQQDEHLEAFDGQVVGAIALARGARTHRALVMARRGGFGDLPFGMGPFGGGWVWAEHDFAHPKAKKRAEWYADCVRYRYLHQPLEEAFRWFAERTPS